MLMPKTEPVTEQELEDITDLLREPLASNPGAIRISIYRLMAEVRRLRELHEDALRQIKLIQEDRRPTRPASGA